MIVVAIGARLKKEEGSCFLYHFSFIWNWKAVKTISLIQIVNKLQQYKPSLYVVLHWLLICCWLLIYQHICCITFVVDSNEYLWCMEFCIIFNPSCWRIPRRQNSFGVCMLVRWWGLQIHIEYTKTHWHDDTALSKCYGGLCWGRHLVLKKGWTIMSHFVQIQYPHLLLMQRHWKLPYSTTSSQVMLAQVTSLMAWKQRTWQEKKWPWG